jgi:hypothetical protein
MDKNETLIILISAAFRIAEPIRILLDDGCSNDKKKFLDWWGLPYAFTIMTHFSHPTNNTLYA